VCVLVQRRRKAVAGIRKSSSDSAFSKASLASSNAKRTVHRDFLRIPAFTALCHEIKGDCFMGMLVEGVWNDVWYDTKSTGGRFKRSEAAFRNWVTADGAPGPSGTGGFAAEAGRYHLYVSLACPWAHSTLIFRKLKGLEEAITVSIVDPLYGQERLGVS
jgi:hypothetical protein